MRRPQVRQLGVWLCGIAVASGCNHYPAREETHAAAVTPAKTIPTAYTACAPEQRARIDVDAVKLALAIRSPYFPQTKPAVLAEPEPVKAEPPQIAEATPEQPAAPPPVAEAAPEQPPAPPPETPVTPVAFTESGECAPCPCPPPEQKLYAIPIGNAVPEVVRTAYEAVPPPPGTTPPAAAIDVEAAFPRAEPAPRRRSFVDITAAPCFGHAPDYCWLSGQVEYSRILHAWRLRYASVDETDRFAGSVTLIENAHVSYLRDGEYVRVEGHLINPNADVPAPSYRIESFKVIENPNDADAAPGTTVDRGSVPAQAASAH